MMKFSEKFDKDCRDFFTKVYIVHGTDYNEWNLNIGDIVLYPPSEIEHDTTSGMSWVGWITENMYTENGKFTQKFIDEVINVDR